MSNIEIVKQWLENPKRKFEDGLNIFKAFASDSQKTKYLTFLEQNKSDKQFSPAMSILTNKIAFIKNQMSLFPDNYKQKVVIKLSTTDSKKKDKVVEIIQEKEELLRDLQSEAESIKERLEDNAWETDGRFQEIENEVENLKKEIGKLNESKIVKVVPFDNLPKPLQKAYKRNQEITPLLASLHADLSKPKLTAKKRKSLVNRIVKLDDERRANWDKLDSYSEGTLPEEMLQEKEQNRYSNDSVIAGSQMQKRVNTLKQNISNCEKTIAETDRELIRQNAQKRLDNYKKELEELNNRLMS